MIEHCMTILQDCLIHNNQISNNKCYNTVKEIKGSYDGCMNGLCVKENNKLLALNQKGITVKRFDIKKENGECRVVTNYNGLKNGYKDLGDRGCMVNVEVDVRHGNVYNNMCYYNKDNLNEVRRRRDVEGSNHNGSIKSTWSKTDAHDLSIDKITNLHDNSELSTLKYKHNGNATLHYKNMMFGNNKDMINLHDNNDDVYKQYKDTNAEYKNMYSSTDKTIYNTKTKNNTENLYSQVEHEQSIDKKENKVVCDHFCSHYNYKLSSNKKVKNNLYINDENNTVKSNHKYKKTTDIKENKFLFQNKNTENVYIDYKIKETTNHEEKNNIPENNIVYKNGENFYSNNKIKFSEDKKENTDVKRIKEKKDIYYKYANLYPRYKIKQSTLKEENYILHENKDDYDNHNSLYTYYKCKQTTDNKQGCDDHNSFNYYYRYKQATDNKNINLTNRNIEGRDDHNSLYPHYKYNQTTDNKTIGKCDDYKYICSNYKYKKTTDNKQSYDDNNSCLKVNNRHNYTYPDYKNNKLAANKQKDTIHSHNDNLYKTGMSRASINVNIKQNFPNVQNKRLHIPHATYSDVMLQSYEISQRYKDLNLDCDTNHKYQHNKNTTIKQAMKKKVKINFQRFLTMEENSLNKRKITDHECLNIGSRDNVVYNKENIKIPTTNKRIKNGNRSNSKNYSNYERDMSSVEDISKSDAENIDNRNKILYNHRSYQKSPRVLSDTILHSDSDIYASRFGYQISADGNINIGERINRNMYRFSRSDDKQRNKYNRSVYDENWYLKDNLHKNKCYNAMQINPENGYNRKQMGSYKRWSNNFIYSKSNINPSICYKYLKPSSLSNTKSFSTKYNQKTTIATTKFLNKKPKIYPYYIECNSKIEANFYKNFLSLSTKLQDLQNNILHKAMCNFFDTYSMQIESIAFIFDFLPFILSSAYIYLVKYLLHTIINRRDLLTFIQTFLACCIISSKYWFDDYQFDFYKYQNFYVCDQFFQFEMEILNAIDFELFVSIDDVVSVTGVKLNDVVEWKSGVESVSVGRRGGMCVNECF